MNSYINTYKRQHVTTASREQILIMLYEAAIRFLNVAKEADKEGNIEKFNNNVIRTQRILTEFMSTLDFEIGGEMAQNLFSLYEYLHYRLVQANMRRDVTMIDEVLNHLRELKETWEEAILLAEQEKKAHDAPDDDSETEKGTLGNNVYSA